MDLYWRSMLMLKKGTFTDFSYLLNGLVIIDKANSCQQPDCSLKMYQQVAILKLVVFQHIISTVDQISIISFGSQQLTVGDFNKYNTLSHNGTPITGTLHNNHNFNNIQNNSIYMITLAPGIQ
ncbi:hypothetical protein DDB_G0280107 [Dictyostelium discoideum AX4]|uniref:Uncharacterized protein n=1 Tax=Dictyostelium discoideum TaxID=44689 RepID=Q54VW0_DICDI|nr:hypothetical protein DDB_G0280107 [Dictyostelium discoideum AX4]EAL67280.1 hypothetical protein DDB_G0280107 [Dictyostelium discoideum AX4]|eukprot:XP_641245.1 hypothetical protein DDB_G0280107 [Dictyostelium discoideum AX4]